MSDNDRRKRALHIFAEKKPVIDKSADLQKVIEEFQIHQIELELENEELRRTMEELQIRNPEQQKEIIRKLSAAEVLLKESEMRYKLLSEVSFEGIVLHQNGMALDANKSVMRMTGFDLDDIPGLNIFNQIADEDKPVALENTRKHYVKPYRVSIIRKDGSRFPAELEARSIEYNGKNIRIVAIRDITERVKIEQALALSEYKFRFYINNAPIGFFVLEASGKYREVNKAFCEITGYSEKQLLQMSLPDILHPSSIDSGLAHFNKMNSQDYVSSELSFVRKDGEVRVWNEISKKLDENSYISFTQDVTEQIKTKEALQNSEQLLNFAIEQMPIPVLISVASEPKDTRYNQLAVDLVNLKQGANGETVLPGHRSILPLLHPDGTPYPAKDLPLTKAISQGISTKNEEIIVHYPDGDRWLAASAEPLRDENGKIIAGIVVFPEITELKKAEAELLERERLLNEVGKIARIGGWEMDFETGKAKWTKGTYDIVEIPYGDPVPGLKEHIDYYLAEYRKMIADKMNDLINNGTELEIEAELVTEKGNIKWCKALGRRQMKDGKCIKAYGTFQDINEQKRLEKEINEKSAQMESLLNNATDYILLCDFQGNPLYYNEAFKKAMKTLTGKEMKPGEEQTSHMKDTKITDFLEKMRKRVLGGEHFTVEFTPPLPDNSIHNLELSFCPVIEKGIIKGYSMIARDITERRLSEQELKESEEKYRLLAETYQNIILIHDPEGKITYMNRYGIDYFGLDIKEIIGTSAELLIQKTETLDEARGLWEKVKQGDYRLHQSEMEFINQAGDKRILEILASPILKNDAPTGMLIVARDITEKMKIDTELKQYREHLEQLVQERTQKLEEQKEELHRFNKLFIGREFRIKELRDKVNNLEEKLKSYGIVVGN